MRFAITAITLLFLKVIVTAEEYNLFGFAGLGYAIEINLGHPAQKLHVLLDTGSSTLAVASKPISDTCAVYFEAQNSTTAYEIGDEAKAAYTEGSWSARLVLDYVYLPTVPTAPTVKANIALITSAYDFFMYGSGWQGILGLAYQEIGARGLFNTVPPWLESVDAAEGKTMSFSIKLCGHPSPTNITHYGHFQLIEDLSQNTNLNRSYHTNILRERWFEIGLLSVRVLDPHKSVHHTSTSVNNLEINSEEEDNVIKPNDCRLLNAAKSIVDCGTTNIRIPSAIYNQVVGELKEAAKASNILILNEFWYHGESACWPEPREFNLPWLAVDILDAANDKHYFTIEYPPQTYMRLMSAHNGEGTISEYCYKLGLEPGDTTVLGAVAFEGLQILFNKQDGWIGFETSNCGPEVRISGPYNTSSSITDLCHLPRPTKHYTAVETKVAQWASAVALAIAMGLLIYLLAPCLRKNLMKSMRRVPNQMSLSSTYLVAQDSA